MRDLRTLNEELGLPHLRARAAYERGIEGNVVHVEGIRYFDVSEQWLKAVREAVWRTAPDLVYLGYQTESIGATGGSKKMHAWFREPSQEEQPL